MSYPDLGCFAECLECEVCKDGLPGLSPLDLGLPDDYSDPDWDSDPFGFDDWEPTPDDGGGIFDDVEVPSAPLPGGGEATPDWDHGPGIHLEWPWG